MSIISEFYPDICFFTTYMLYVSYNLGNVLDLFSAIVEKNPGRFRLDAAEVIQRRYFIQQTKDEILDIKDKVQTMKARDSDHGSRKVCNIFCIFLLLQNEFLINFLSLLLFN